MEETKVTEEIKRAFNHGYMMREKIPELLKGMHVSENEPSEYTKLFQAGVSQYEKDEAHGLSKSEVNLARSQGKDRNIDMDR